MSGGSRLKVKIQLYCGDEIAMGPGKADLLDAIVRGGSISRGAKLMGMSYRRAWLLVDAMNRCWSMPLVETDPGGGRDHGGRVSQLGHRVLELYRTMVARAEGTAAGNAWTELSGQLLEQPRAKQGDGV